ncbi:hypothetical protein AOPFMNJM_3693 [Methylobacterium jeotgali]|jgi:hypothetical protein|uniref:Uncharacterized protein n=1 Tax=Methylobacterium jeotgali TaxID=381630 RepID=A0ABQ4T1L6_9HYPH|nr:hypothetical protein AwMethylo_10240 [Methylobacterium sp.]GJE08356.1 hypothetical protein AOPFMNJM_3693 [Methylobacterium jeotgali]
MSPLTGAFLTLLFGPMAVALVLAGCVILLEKREKPPRYVEQGRPALRLVHN